MIAQRRKKHSDPLRKPSPAIVPTELPVFEELQRLGLVVPVSKRPSSGKASKPVRRRRSG